MRLMKWLLGLVFSAVALCQQPAALTLHGLDGNVITVNAEELAKLPHHAVKASEHGTAVTFDAVLLSDILAKVNLPVGDKLKGKALSQLVVAEAADGYRVLFALPELDPALTDHPVHLVTKRDGQPLSEKEGPFKIVAPNDKHPSRWVRQVRQVTALWIKQAD